MTIEEKEKIYFAQQDIECAESVLVILKNDMQSDNGVSDRVLGNALKFVINGLNDINKKLNSMENSGM